MQVYKSKYGLLTGTTYEEVVHNARKEFNAVRRLTKRQPYVKSKYFRGDKVFITVFWDHIVQKNLKERTKRLKFYKAGLDLIRNTTQAPEIMIDKAHPGMVFNRFYGVTKTGEHFCVQIKQDARTNRRDFMSVFDKKQK